MAGDTGVDVDSCMYWDAASPRFMFDELQPENRKIIKYISKFGNDGDNVHGHGSHVTGSITGNPRTLAGHAKVLHAACRLQQLISAHRLVSATLRAWHPTPS